MGNFIGWCGRSSTSPTHILPDIILSPSPSSGETPHLPNSDTGDTGVSGRDLSGKGFCSDTSSSGNSGFSFGEHPWLNSSSSPEKGGELLDKPNLRVFCFAELKNATKNFRPETVLGEGGFGRVYKGWIDDKIKSSSSKLAVAIKKLHSESLQGFEEWQSEINFLGRLSHPNLVKLLGYCWEDKELLLVYEYLPKGNLENHLFRRNPSMEPLGWDRRMSIALGVAQGLAFLHTPEKQIIYRDFKASNILLDVNYEPKLSDFGLAKLGPSGGNSHVTTRIMGTYGYAAPEYVATGHLYVNSDVYGFGVVLLEILTGLRALDLNRPKGQQNLVEWAKSFLTNKNKLRRIMDARLEGQYSLKAACELAQLTAKCLGPDPKVRPCMKDVVEVLQRIEAIKVKLKPNERRPTSGSYSAADYRHSGSTHRSPFNSQLKAAGNKV